MDKKCLFCGGIPSVIGVFTPIRPDLWKQKYGSMCFYYLCKKCINSESPVTVAEMVENYIAKDMGLRVEPKENN